MKVEEVLLHYGVKGMKWGVRNSASRRLNRASNKLNSAYSKGLKGSDKRALKKLSSAEARKKYLDDKDAKWLAKVNNDAKAQKVSKRTARDMRKVGKELKAEYGNGLSRAVHPRNKAKFNNELQSAYEEVLAANTYSVYKTSPSRTKQVVLKPMGDGTIKAVVEDRNTVKLNKQMASVTKSANKRAKKEAEKSIKHSDSDLDILDGMFFIITVDSEGWPEDVYEYTEGAVLSEVVQQSGLEDVYIGELDHDDILKHWGVKGMKWGVRKSRSANSDSKKEKPPKKPSKRQQKKEAEKLRKESNKLAKSHRKEYMKRKNLTDEELKKKVERLRLENEFDRLSKEASKSQIAKGKSELNKLLETKVPDSVNNMLGTSGKTVGAVIANVAIKEAIKYATNKAANPSSKTSSNTTRSKSKKSSKPTVTMIDSGRPRKDVTPG